MAIRLSLEETKKCLISWREFNDKDALTLLFMCNSGLVGFIAKKYLSSGLTFDELVSAGNEGLLNAINKFDYKQRKIEIFSSYISVAIENSIRYELKKYNKHRHVLSFEQLVVQNKDGDEFTIDDIIGTDKEELYDNVIENIKINIVKEALQCLTEREQQIILLRYGLDETQRKTQEEVGNIFGVTGERIRQIEDKALKKLRHPKIIRKLKDFIEE